MRASFKTDIATLLQQNLSTLLGGAGVTVGNNVTIFPIQHRSLLSAKDNLYSINCNRTFAMFRRFSYLTLSKAVDRLFEAWYYYY